MTQVAELKLTAIQRSVADAVGLAQRGDHDRSAPWDAAATSMATELKALRRKVNILYLGTTLGAFLILAPPSVAGLNLEAFGVQVPLSVLSKQALAVVLCGAYGYYVSAVVSGALLYGLMAAIFSRAAPESWEYLLCRYDADFLWTSLLKPKILGYTCKRGEGFIGCVVQLSNGAVVLSHSVLVVGAITVAAAAAWQGRNIFGIALGTIALVGALGAVFGVLGALYWKLRYQAPGAAGQQA